MLNYNCMPQLLHVFTNSRTDSLRKRLLALICIYADMLLPNS